MNIIIIDDDKNFLKTMQLELQDSRGIEKIYLAGNEKEAFDLLGKDDVNPDVALVDINFKNNEEPDATGIDILRRIKTDPNT